MTKQELIEKMVNWWTEKLGAASEYGSEKLNSVLAQPKSIAEGKKQLFKKALTAILEEELKELEVVEEFYLEVDYNPDDILFGALILADLDEYSLPGKSVTGITSGKAFCKYGYNGDFLPL